MNIIDKKPQGQQSNYFYGVDVNDKAAVQQEFERLQKQHKNVTIIVVVVLIILGIIFFDFARVNFVGGKPIFAIESKVEHGTLFSGLGYKVLYCDNGERIVGSVLYQSCNEVDERTFSNVVYRTFLDYGYKNNLLNKENLKTFTINSLSFDEKNKEGGSDYLINIKYECNDGTGNCFKTSKEFLDYGNVNLYVGFNKYNEIYDVFYFKNTGIYTEQLTTILTENIKKYMIDNAKLTVDNLRNFSIKLIENHGKYNFRGNEYYDSYLVEINYMCNDNTNTCLVPFDNQDQEGDYANLSFYTSVFVDSENNVMLMGPKEYFDL